MVHRSKHREHVETWQHGDKRKSTDVIEYGALMQASFGDKSCKKSKRPIPRDGEFSKNDYKVIAYSKCKTIGNIDQRNHRGRTCDGQEARQNDAFGGIWTTDANNR